MTAWRRETMASGSTRSLEGSRPIESRDRGSRISRRVEDVGLTMSLAVLVNAALPCLEGLPEVDADLDGHALLHARLVLPVAHGVQHGVVEDLAARLDDLEVADVPLLADDEGHDDR